MKSKAIIPLAVGLGVGLVAVKLGIDTIQKSQAAMANRDTVAVLRAVQDIGPYVQLTAEMFDTVETDRNALLVKGQVLGDPEAALKRVTAKSIPAGAPILETMLAPEGTPPGVAGMVQPGYRAYSVEIDEATGVAYQLKPGDWVDVIVVMDIPKRDGGRGNETIAEVLLQRVQILAVGRSAPGDKEESSGRGRPSRAAKTVTLHIHQADQQTLDYAAKRGQISLSLRSDGDENTADATGLKTLNDILPSLRQAAEQQATAQSAGPSWWQQLFAASTDASPVTFEPTEPAPTFDQPDPPFTVVVYRGGQEGTQATVEWITFANAQSRQVLQSKQQRAGASKSGGNADATSRLDQLRAQGIPVDKPDRTADEVDPESFDSDSQTAREGD